MDNKNADRKRVAVLIDAENISLEYYEAVLAKAEEEGDLIVKRAYKDFSYTLEYPITPDKTPKKLMKAAITQEKSKKKLLKLAINPVQCYSIVTGKNTADLYLAMDAMELLYEKNIDVFCLASSDSDFVPLVVKLKESGKRVVGIGESKSVSAFKIACNEFVTLDADKKAPTQPAKAAPQAVKPAPNTQIAQDNAKSTAAEEEQLAANLEGFPQIDEDSTDNAEAIDSENGADYFAAECDAEEYAVTEDTAPSEASEKTEKTALETAIPLQAEQLKADILSVVKTEADQNGCILLTTVITELQKRFPGFSARSCGYDSATHMIESLGFTLYDKGLATAYIWLDNGNPDAVPMAIKRERLFSQIASIIEEYADDGGWCLQSVIIVQLRKLDPYFSYDNYGVKKCGELFKLASNILETESRHLDPTNPKSSCDYARLKKPPKPLEELRADIESSIRNAPTTEGGWVKFRYVSDQLNSQSAFSPDMYGYNNMKELLDQLGFETERTNGVSRVRIPASDIHTEAEESTALSTDSETEAAANTDPTYENTVDDGDGVTLRVEAAPADGNTADTSVTESETESDTEKDSKDTPAEEEQPSNGYDGSENSDGSESSENSENSEGSEESEEEEETYVLPVVNELPEQIGTLEELKTAILFILNHESVSSPTRLTAAIKYWYPDFKLKDYGYTKMSKLLEDLEIYVF